MTEAAQAFQSAMDAETPSRSRQGQEKPKRETQQIDDLFPARRMDRSEREGGETQDDPDQVKRARRETEAERPQREPAHDDEPQEEDVDEDDLEDEDEPQEEPGEPDDDEDEEEPRAAFDPEQVVRITVDGEPVEVSLGEMAKGYTRTATFHKRMGELGQGVQALHQAKLELDAERNSHLERTQALEQYIAAFMPKEPDWNALRQANPAEAANLRFEWEDFQRKLGGLAQSRAETQAQLQAAYQERLTQFANANRAQLANRHPEWKNEKVWRRDNESMNRTARGVGYTDEEIRQLYDARAVEILLMASRYQRMMANKPKPVRQPPKNGNGATRPRPNVSRSFDRAEKRLSRSGSVSDAAAVFERMLDREG